MKRGIALVGLVMAYGFGCGGPKAPPPPPPPPSAHAATPHKCGDKDKVHTIDLHDDDADRVHSPCSDSGHHDFSGLVHFESVEKGVKIIVEARDDEVTILGPGVKERDAVTVHPTGPDGKSEDIEVHLTHVKGGYRGEKLVLWSSLHKLTDEGTRLEVKIYDHDKESGHHEEFKISVAVSTGKSCEKAIDENPQEVVMGKKSAPDLTKEQLGAPMQTDAFMRHCGLSDSAHAQICAAVKKGKPLGVSVQIAPTDNRVAACVDKAVRKLGFPQSDKLDVVKQSF